MILTTKENFKNYLSINKHLPAAFDALLAIAETEFVSGKYVIEGENIFINAAIYTTHSVNESQMEAHRKYMDVMFMLSGEECILISTVEKASDCLRAYNSQEDVLFAKIPDIYSQFILSKGCIAVLFPEDAHAPGVAISAPSCVKKLIAKVAID